MEKTNEEKLTKKEQLLTNWSEIATKKSLVKSELYTKYDVKRGLRDVNGKGVLAGLTQIGEVHAYNADGSSAHGKLIYRGIEIQDLVNGFSASEHFGFEETCYLLLFGDLPNKKELKSFEDMLVESRKLSKRFVHDGILKMPSSDVMNAMARAVLGLYTFDKDPDNISIKNILEQCIKLIATFPLLAVYSYRAYIHQFEGKSLVIHHPKPELSTAENILYMLRSDSKYTDLEAKLLDISLVLHAEHGGGNNSTFATHLLSSSGTDTYSTIAGALGSLKGPRHGGANIKAVHMFDEIKKEIKDWENDEEVKSYILKLLNKEAFDNSGLIYGIGHAVYSLSDPRAIILRDYAKKLAEEKGLLDEFNLHVKIETLAPEIIGEKRKIYKGVSANVDFFSGFVYKMLGIPEELYTPLFAIARIAGWSAHRIEEMSNGGKIIRPAYKGIAEPRNYIPIHER